MHPLLGSFSSRKLSEIDCHVRWHLGCKLAESVAQENLFLLIFMFVKQIVVKSCRKMRRVTTTEFAQIPWTT